MVPQAPSVVRRLKSDLNRAVCIIWKAPHPVASKWVRSDAMMWGIDSFKIATIDMPSTHTWKAMNVISSRFVLSNFMTGQLRVSRH